MDIYNSKFALLFAPKGKTQWAITMPWGTHYSVTKSQVRPPWRHGNAGENAYSRSVASSRGNAIVLATNIATRSA